MHTYIVSASTEHSQTHLYTTFTFFKFPFTTTLMSSPPYNNHRATCTCTCTYIHDHILITNNTGPELSTNFVLLNNSLSLVSSRILLHHTGHSHDTFVFAEQAPLSMSSQLLQAFSANVFSVFVLNA